MQLFELNSNGALELAPHTLQIKAFKDIWDRDKSKNKKTAEIELGFVYFMMHWRSVYRKYPAEDGERERKIIEDVFYDEDWKPDTLVNIACDKYKELSSSILTLLVEDSETAIHTLRKYLRTVDLTKKDDRTGKPIHSAKDLMMNLKSVGDVVIGLKKLKAEVEKGTIENSSIKGGGIAGAFEDVE